MKFQKKLLPLLYVVNSLSHAGTMGDSCAVVSPYLPCESQGWQVGGQALYLKPDLGSLNVRGLQISDRGVRANKTYDPNYQWGFKLEADYQFQSGRDFNANWYRVQGTQFRNFGAILSNAGDSLASGSGSINPTWNAANAEIGQTLNFNDLRHMRVHAGVQYARIGLDEYKRGEVITPDGLVANSSTINRVFNGFGPRVGADFVESWGSGLGLYGKVATAMLAGSASSDTSYTRLYENRTLSLNAVVPEVELNLGVNYNHSVANGNLAVDVGWMWVNYFSAIVYDDYNVKSNAMNIEKVNFGLQGVFFGLKWTGNTLL